MKSFKRVLCLSLVFIMLLTLPSGAFAQPIAQDQVENSVTVYSSQIDEEALADLLCDPSIDCVNVIFDDDFDTDSALASAENDTGTVSPFAFGGGGGVVNLYYVKNVRSAPDVYGANVLAKAKGVPGITISINTTEEVAVTLNGTYGVTTSTIEASVGWEVTGTTSVAIQGSFTVPATNGNRAVKSAELTATPIYRVKKFDCYTRIQGSSTETYLGTGTTMRAYGVSFHKTFQYV